MTMIDKIRAAGTAGQLLPGAVEMLTAWIEAACPNGGHGGDCGTRRREAWGEI